MTADADTAVWPPPDPVEDAADRLAAAYDPTPDRLRAFAARPLPDESLRSYGGPRPDSAGPLYLYDRTPRRPACSRCHRIMDAEDWAAHCADRHPGAHPEPEIRR